MLKAYIADKEENLKAVGNAYLTVAWRFDDLKQEENAINARLKALDYFMRCYDQQKNLNLAIIIGDIYRRTKRFDYADDWFAKINVGFDEKFIPIIRFERYLIRQQDSSRHSLAEI